MPELKTSDPLHITVVAQQDGSDWFNIETDGEPKRLKTMQENFGLEAGRHRSSGALVRVKFSERHDKPNPHGGFYHDFYYSGAEVVEEAASNGVTRTPAPSGEHNRATDPGDAWRICLSVGSERAVQSLQYLPPGQQDFPYQWALAYEWAARIYTTPPPNPDELEPISVGGQSAGAYHDPTEPPGDDDIPF
jgi:hypothetical protein